ncbi:MAG: LamG domain-containing protein [Pirellulales bacterium]|nr:LamG domain-containing protein [Pirellulales bacterium]
MPSLQFGRMTAAFRSDDDEFTLDTPLGRVVVSGHASVGIVAAADEVELHTFSGAARFEYWLTDVERAPNRVSVEPGMSTHARVASGGGLSIEHGKARENHFAAKRDSVDSHLVISDKYVRKILQAKPLGYWRFESDEGGVIRNEAADRLHCRIIGDAIRLRSAGGNRTAEFGATAGSGYLFSEDVVEGIGDSYTTEVWIKPSYYHHAIIFSLVEPHDSSFMQHQFLMELCGPGPGAPATRIWDEHPKQIRFLHRGINRDEPSQCYSQGPYVLGKWQHVAVVKDAEEVRSYVDGEFVASVKDTFPLGDRLHVLMGQLYPKDSSGREVWLARLFVGQLDEVAFYDRALTAEEINQHYHAVRPEPTGAPDTVSSARDTS